MNLNNRPTKTEREIQADLISWLKKLSRNITVLKINVTAGVPQGFPDVLVLYNGGFIAIEVKKGADADFQPNQKYYLARFNNMTHGTALIYYPEIAGFVKAKIKAILLSTNSL